MSGQHRGRRRGFALLALPLLCCAGHALVLALGITSLSALLSTRTPVIVLAGLLVLAALSLAVPTIHSFGPQHRSEQS